MPTTWNPFSRQVMTVTTRIWHMLTEHLGKRYLKVQPCSSANHRYDSRSRSAHRGRFIWFAARLTLSYIYICRGRPRMSFSGWNSGTMDPNCDCRHGVNLVIAEFELNKLKRLHVLKNISECLVFELRIDLRLSDKVKVQVKEHNHLCLVQHSLCLRSAPFAFLVDLRSLPSQLAVSCLVDC